MIDYNGVVETLGGDGLEGFCLLNADSGFGLLARSICVCVCEKRESGRHKRPSSGRKGGVGAAITVKRKPYAINPKTFAKSPESSKSLYQAFGLF